MRSSRAEAEISAMVKLVFAVLVIFALVIIVMKMTGAWEVVQIAFGKDDPTALFKEGENLYLDGKYSDARKKLEPIVKNFPNSEEYFAAHIYLAMSYAAIDTDDSQKRAVEEIDKILEKPYSSSVTSPLEKQRSQISIDTWGCVDYGPEGCLYGVKPGGTGTCACHMGVE